MKIPVPSFSALVNRTFAMRTVAVIVMVAIVGVAAWVGWSGYQQSQTLHQQVQQLDDAYQKALGEGHVSFLQAKDLAQEKAQLEADMSAWQSDPAHQEQATIDNLFVQFQGIQSKVARNNGVKLDTSSITGQYNDWGQKLLNKQFDQLASALTGAGQTLDTQYQQYQASLITPTPKPARTVSSGQSSGSTGSSSQPYGYSHQTVNTSRGSFSVSLVKMKLSEVTVKTVTANTSNCTDQCPTKSLAQYVSENGGYAGMNGTYFCPADYSSCAGKVASYDFAVYNSNLGQWMNANALTWDSTGMATFSGHSATFYHTSHQYDGHPVTAGISNFPPLLVQNGQVITDASQQDASMQTKGLKGAMGVDGTYIYLADVSNATVTDTAYVMQALGARDVINMDGGGSAAIYVDGSYKVGPGRVLPNAVVLVRN